MLYTLYGKWLKIPPGPQQHIAIPAKNRTACALGSLNSELCPSSTLDTEMVVNGNPGLLSLFFIFLSVNVRHLSSVDGVRNNQSMIAAYTHTMVVPKRNYET